MNNHLPRLAEPISDTRVRTLVADDSPVMLKLLARILDRAGSFDLVGTATDGCQALRYVSALSPHLVLMDLHLPRLNGIQATRYIKQREQPPAVIIITSDDSSLAKSMAETAGADGFIVKTDNLGLRLTRTLKSFFGPNGARRTAANSTPRQNAPAAHPHQDHGR
jgi:DNA-binding NarL/FixJ family response regulator